MIKQNSTRLSNEVLQKKLNEKSDAIKQLSRELEIETALEKVRTVAMAMKKSADMLTVCKTISLQLQSLGVKEIRNVQTAIFYESRSSYMNYEYYAKHKKTFITETSYTNHKIHKAFAQKMLRGKGEIYISHIKGKKVKEWIAYQKTTNVFIDRYLQQTDSLNYYWHSLGPVALGISTYLPLNKEEINLFKRFLNVFEMAYTRYLDIEQALAQAKEAQIEASLEKVRAQALGMQKPEDLPTVCEVLFKELKILGFDDLRNAMVNIHNDDKRTFVNYDYSDEMGKSITPLLYDIHPVIKKQIKQIRSADDAFSETVFKGKDLASWKAFRKSRGEKEDKRIKNSTAHYYYFYSIGTGSIGISAFNAISKEKQDVLKRFRNVFAFAYRRYIDVAQAIAQAREAQIELALERVRARTMAMQNSNELFETAYVLFQQFRELGEAPDQITIGIINEQEKVIEFWLPIQGNQTNNTVKASIDEPTVMNKMFVAWKKQKKSLVIDLTGKELDNYIHYRATLSKESRLPVVKKNHSEKRRLINAAFFKKGLLTFSSPNPSSQESIQLLERFAGVFDLTYTRFLDLKKAEAQAREAQIELGLERVRARAMAMQHSDELAELVTVVFNELTHLDFHITSSIIWINNPELLTNTLWVTSAEMNQPARPIQLSPFQHDFFHSIIHAWKDKDPKWIYLLTGNGKTSFEKSFFKGAPGLPKALKSALTVPENVVFSATFNNFGALELIGTEPLTDEKFDILHRFGNVFNSSYTRFNDLKKAEAQAREAQIEACLERVRSKTMAMHNSKDVGETVASLFDEYSKLGIETFRCGIGTIHQERKMEVWTAKRNADGMVNFFTGYMDMTMHPLLLGAYSAWKKKEESYEYELKGDDLKEYFSRINNNPHYPLKYNLSSLPSRLIFSTFYFVEGFLFAFTLEKISTESKKIFKRFSFVFGQTYRRFLDLQKAESQAREAQIEAALERVRSRSMAMQKSEELQEVIKLVYQQLIHLNIKLDHAGFVVDYKPKGDWHFWIADEQDIPSKITHPYFESVWASQFNEAKEKSADIFATNLNFEEKNKFYTELLSYVPGLPQVSIDFYLSCPGLAATTVVLEDIGLYIENFSGIPYTNEENKTLMRFGKVFQQTYTRFLDLQKAEAQAREAKIELALERVRAKAMAMYSSDELSNLVALLFEELIKLDLILYRCIIWIFDPQTMAARLWTANSEDRNNAESYFVKRLHHPYYDAIINGWRERIPKWVYELQGDDKKTIDALLLNETELSRLPEAVKKGILASQHTIISGSFNNFGFIEASGPLPHSDEQLEILNRFGKVFDLSYTRFNDLQKAEAQAEIARLNLIQIQEEKQRAEDALAELQVTQKQLIQSEKMASLGELTAGIAHEIQNPLNFVNNFSEVNEELLAEMKDELDKGNIDDAKAIANDAIENQQKILHHGKRADAIVKGMLQHSRSSSGIKEATDINALADEYLRLAYHGLRAKDKSFNATMKTDFDESIGNINIIPQDIGRVILNLITNAFYAASLPSKGGFSDSDKNDNPTIWVSTKKRGDKVLISVRDNGPGIPQKILDKIFQPFFTTKPTGQGTGLGLSLSYDIVKAHGGELKVETKEGEGSEFIIQLPVV
jgi:signal transduction histidine kinase